MFVFRKILCASCSCYLRLEIHHFVLLLSSYRKGLNLIFRKLWIHGINEGGNRNIGRELTLSLHENSKIACERYPPLCLYSLS